PELSRTRSHQLAGPRTGHDQESARPMDAAPSKAVSSLSIPPHEPVPGEPSWSVLPSSASTGLIEISPPSPVWRPFELLAKRAVDVAGAAAGLALLAPLLVAVAVAIRLDSPGPVLFRQRRLGREGRPFWIWKFRTMRADAEQRLAELEARNEAARGVLF